MCRDCGGSEIGKTYNFDGGEAVRAEAESRGNKTSEHGLDR